MLIFEACLNFVYKKTRIFDKFVLGFDNLKQIPSKNINLKKKLIS